MAMPELTPTEQGRIQEFSLGMGDGERFARAYNGPGGVQGSGGQRAKPPEAERHSLFRCQIRVESGPLSRF